MPTTRAADTAPTTDEVNRLRLVLLRIVRRIRASAHTDVTPSQVAVVATLVRHGPSTIGQIAQYEHVRPPSASKIVANLEARGLVERHPDPDDRRSTRIALSDAGERYVADARAAATSWLSTRLAELESDEVAVLLAAVPVLERLLGDPE